MAYPVLAVSSSVASDRQNQSPLKKKKKTREFQTQLLHYFSKSDNKSNHHHEARCAQIAAGNLRRDVQRVEHADSKHLCQPNGESVM